MAVTTSVEEWPRKVMAISLLALGEVCFTQNLSNVLGLAALYKFRTSILTQMSYFSEAFIA
jgi:hypothetical protein